MRTGWMVSALVTVLAAGCGGSSAGSSSAAPTTSPSASAVAASVLPTGKELIALESRTYRSPEGFVPAVSMDVPPGWSSSHRFADAFDISQPDPARDAPGVAVVWMTPGAGTAAEALKAVTSVAGTAARPVTGRIGTAAAAGVDITDGTGTVVQSAQRGISIDAAKGQRLRVLAADIGGKPLVVVVLVPVAANWTAMAARAQVLIDSVRPV